MTTLTHNYIEINGVNIHYVGSQYKNLDTDHKSTLLFLHGFPEYWQTWQQQLDYFSNDYRVIAPDLPGYNLSDKPLNNSFYKLPNLIDFFACFIKKICPDEKIFLVAHDWGGAIAWPLTAFYSQLIEKLIILNAAHPSTFTREMINNPEQRNKSEYIHELINGSAVQLLSKNNYQYLSEKMMVSANPNIFTDDIKKKYRQVWRQQGAINGMLQYYRAMPQLAASNKKITEKHNLISSEAVKKTANMKIPNIRIKVPTLVFWGELDQAFVVENLHHLEQYVPDCLIKRFADASHWLQHEKSPEINEAIKLFINS